MDIINANRSEESAQSKMFSRCILMRKIGTKIDLYLELQPRKSQLPTNVVDL